MAERNLDRRTKAPSGPEARPAWSAVAERRLGEAGQSARKRGADSIPSTTGANSPVAGLRTRSMPLDTPK